MEYQTIVYCLEEGTDRERRISLEKKPETPHGAFVNGSLVPGWPLLEDFATWCEQLWYALGISYRREN